MQEGREASNSREAATAGKQATAGTPATAGALVAHVFSLKSRKFVNITKNWLKDIFKTRWKSPFIVELELISPLAIRI
jgi:F0F1-type ATP synthase membrane subunit a